jgi:hypothetical protein
MRDDVNRFSDKSNASSKNTCELFQRFKLHRLQGLMLGWIVGKEGNHSLYRLQQKLQDSKRHVYEVSTLTYYTLLV